MIQLTGLMAGILTSTAALPQVIKVWKTKDAGDLSLKTYTILNSGLLLWVIYGFMKSDFPIISTNILALTLNGIILYFKLRFGK